VRHGTREHRPQRPAGRARPALRDADDVEQAHGNSAAVERAPRLGARRIPAPLTRPAPQVGAVSSYAIPS
jgi:hypothetical protein